MNIISTQPCGGVTSLFPGTTQRSKVGDLYIPILGQ